MTQMDQMNQVTPQVSVEEPEAQTTDSMFDYLEAIILDLPTAILVDSRAAETLGAALGAQISMGKLLGHVRDVCQLHSASYYYAYPIAPDSRGIRTHSFLEYLRKEGWQSWWTTPNRVDPTSPRISPKVKLSVDAMRLVIGGAKQILLAVKGPDFEPLVETLRGLGCRVVMFSWSDYTPTADAILDIRRILPLITVDEASED
jgi:NYN domain